MEQKEKQTAVEWLIIKDSQATIDFIEGKITSLELAVKKATFIEQAKAMERQQIQDAVVEYLKSVSKEMGVPMKKISISYDEKLTIRVSG